jgi:hypothetical protein
MDALPPKQRSPRISEITGTIRRGSRPAALVCSAVAILALITLSPLALEFIAARGRVDWTKLGNVGQAYGAISAILSALALVAVSISLALQAKESLANRRQVHRNIHMRLAEMAMSDPIFMECWGPEAEKFSHDENRRTQFLNLMVSFWYMQWELKDVTDDGLRSMAAENLFHTDGGRKFWLDNREQWTATSVGSRLNKFREVLDQGLALALKSELSSQVVARKRTRRPGLETREAAGVIAVASTTAAACLLARDLLRKRKFSADLYRRG